jgi:hypothetical protein
MNGMLKIKIINNNNMEFHYNDQISIKLSINN